MRICCMRSHHRPAMIRPVRARRVVQRPFSCCSIVRQALDGTTPFFAAGPKRRELHDAYLELISAPKNHWELTPDRKGLQRIFVFKTFKTTWEFMHAVAKEAHARRHHPEWFNVYNKIYMRWTTHDPPGLSLPDVELAQFCHERATAMGELVDEGTGDPIPLRRHYDFLARFRLPVHNLTPLEARKRGKKKSDD